MKKSLILLVVVLIAGVFAAWSTAADSDSDTLRIASLVKEMKSLEFNKIEMLPAIPPQPFTLPRPGVDVMRARLTETYEIDGLGEDTVELTGWIAVTHGKPSTNEWRTAVTDTQFVALDLRGHSDVFGPVEVTFDPDRPVIGKVGAIDLPERARLALAAVSAPSPPHASEVPEETTEPTSEVCFAPVNVAVAMPALGLQMKTKEAAAWYSLVTTIPPVGHTASVTIDPIRLISNGREVGTLVSGHVKFRETVRHVPLSDSVDVKVALAAP